MRPGEEDKALADFSLLRRQAPKVLARRSLKASIFTVEELDLEFSNGTRRTYDRLYGGPGAVLAVPFDGRDFLFSVEYACGFERYELSFVKGKIDPGETPGQACARELGEELGFGARSIVPLRDCISTAPGMMSLKMYSFLCTDLYRHEVTGGDEPEPVELIRVSLEEARPLLFDEHSPLTESRSIASLLLAMHKLGAL